MTRILTVGAAQLGPIQREESRGSAVARMIELMRQAKSNGCDLVVYPEAALTAFFPHWWMDDEAEIDSYFESAMPSNETAPLFAEAERLGIGFHLGYPELAFEDGRKRRFNTAIIVDKSGKIVGKYRKIHLPGTRDPIGDPEFEHLEKRYFEVGNLGFPSFATPSGRFGMCICNDRRWPETFRTMALRGAEVFLLGYNTPTRNIHHPEPAHLREFHNRLSLESAAYQNGAWVMAAAKCGSEDGFAMIGGSAMKLETTSRMRGSRCSISSIRCVWTCERTATKSSFAIASALKAPSTAWRVTGWSARTKIW